MPQDQPNRPAVARLYRVPLERIERWVPLPPLPPAVWSAASLAAAALTLVVAPWWGQALLVAAALVADWLDGATARRYQLTSPSGYVTDVVLDRVGEGLMILAGRGTLVGTLFLAAWWLNLALVAYSLRTGRHRILPLRFAWLVVLVVAPWWPPV
jgi:hypothetical protein